MTKRRQESKAAKKLLPYLYHGDPRAAVGVDPCMEVAGYAPPPAGIQRRGLKRARTQSRSK